MPQEETITILPRYGGYELRVRLRWYRGRLIIDVRNFYSGTDGEMLPTKAGVAFGVRKLSQIIDALEKARDRVNEIARENSAENSA